MNKPEFLKEFLNSIDYAHLGEFVDTCWLIADDEVYWNKDDNRESLFLQDGETYGGYLPEGVAEREGYTVANYYNGCGQWITLFLNNEKQVTLAELEEEFA